MAYCVESAAPMALSPESLQPALMQITLDEQHAYSDAVESSLREMGFAVDRRDETDDNGLLRSMVWATGDDGVIAVEVGPHGQIELDSAVCEDDACIPIQHELIEQLAQRGVEIDLHRTTELLHGDPRGGELIRRWTRQFNGHAIAQAATEWVDAKQHSRQLSGPTPRRRSPRPTPQQRELGR
jgi:hypothetical protein